MKRTLFTIAIIVCAVASYGQKYMTRTGRIFFSADAPGNPEVEATNNEVASVLDPGSGDLVFQVPIRSFKFKKELMQTHFNENYMESDKYPHAEFKGTVNAGGVNFNKDGEYKTNVAGNLTIHGVTHQVNVPGTITVKEGTAALRARFSVSVKDYGINIPATVADKVSKEASIDVDCLLAKQ